MTNHSKNFYEKVSDMIDIWKNMILNFKVLNYSFTIETRAINPEVFEKGIGIVQKDRLQSAMKYLQFTYDCDLFSSIINLYTTLFGTSKRSAESLRDVLQDDKIYKMIHFIVNSDHQLFGYHEDWIRIFSQGRSYLLDAWLKSANLLLSRNKNNDFECKLVSDLIYPGAITLATILLPGDDFIGWKTITDVIISPNYIEDIEIVKPMTEFLKEFYFFHDAICYSESIWGDDVSKFRPSCLVFQSQEQSCSAYPLRLDWIYAPFEQMYMNPRTAIKPEHVVSLLSFIKNMESSFKGNSEMFAKETKIVSIMHVFLLTDSTGEELFRNENIKCLLIWAFENLTSTNLEDAFTQKRAQKLATQSRFYELYQNLIDHFLSVSFGDEVFSRYLSLPLAMSYPVDYRLLFWQSIGKMVRIIKWNVSDLQQQNISPFISPRETSQHLIQIYKKVLADGLITSNENPVLFEIAMSHTKIR